MFAEGTASRISRRPDLDSRHDLADGIDDLLRNALRFLGARLGFFEAGVKLPQSLLGSPRFAAASRRRRFSSTILSLFRGCHVQILAEGGRAWKDYPYIKRKRPI
jgi:hypothetical protein